MSAETAVDVLLETVVAALAATAGVAGRVSEDRTRPFTREEAPAVDVRLVEATSDTLGDDHPARSVLQVRVLFELGVYVRSELRHDGTEAAVRALAAPVWKSAHTLLMADPSFGGKALRLRWRGSTWQRENADGTAGWANHRYEATLAVREQSLLAP